jgi:hypothetical protein
MKNAAPGEKGRSRRPIEGMIILERLDMEGVSLKHLFWGLIALLLLSALTACGSAAYAAPTPTPKGQVPVATDLRDLYRDLGGEAELGPAISALHIRTGGAACQYTTNVMLCFNASARSEADRLYVAPLGKDFNLAVSTTKGQTPAIYEGFSEVYHKKFFGARYVGAPLTGVRYNEEKRRLEQYFERMGFYTLVDDPQKNVYLLAYGSYSCREECAHNSMDPSYIGWNKGTDVLLPKIVDRLGGYSTFGSPLGAPYAAKDGSFQQILDKIVVYTPANNPNVLRLRPLAVELNMPHMAPGPQRFGAKENMLFYVSHDEVGYHVPTMFDEFIAQHGGLEISGQPLSDPYEVTIDNQQVGRQCFENYCLDYLPNASEKQRVVMAPLGKMYLQRQQKGSVQENFRFSSATVALTVSEKKPQLTNQDTQTVQLLLLTRQSRQPISDVESFVVIALPNGKKLSYNLPPTNQNGLAQVSVQPLKDVANGVIIPYVICLNVPSDDAICEPDSFLIWNNR